MDICESIFAPQSEYFCAEPFKKLKIKMKNMMVVLERIITMLPMSKNIAQKLSCRNGELQWCVYETVIYDIKVCAFKYVWL